MEGERIRKVLTEEGPKDQSNSSFSESALTDNKTSKNEENENAAENVLQKKEDVL